MQRALLASQADILSAIALANNHASKGRPVVVNCAQGKSRSGTFAVSLLMHNRDMSAQAALELIQSRRPLVQPNPGFLRQLAALEDTIRAAGRGRGSE